LRFYSYDDEKHILENHDVGPFFEYGILVLHYSGYAVQYRFDMM